VRPNEDEVSFSDIFELLWRHRLLILGSSILCIAVGIWLALAPRKYSADGILRVQLGSDTKYQSSPTSPATGLPADEYSPYVDILQSRTLFLQVAKDLDLANNPMFLGSPVHGHKSLDDPAIRNNVLRTMQARIAVTHKPKDEIIRISCSTFSPALSARVVNTLINDFIDQLVRSRYDASTRASAWLTGQLGDLKRQVEQDQSNLTALQGKLGIVGLNDKDTDYLLAQSLDSLNKAASEATVQRIVAEAKYRFLQDADPSLIEGEVNLLASTNGNSPPSSLLQTLRSAQAVQSSDYAHLLAQFGPNYPDVVQKKSQLDETKRQVAAEENRILNQAKLSFSAASANEQMTQHELQGQEQQSSQIHNDMVKFVILQHDYESHRTLYESLISRLQEAGITSGLGGGEVEIVDLADVPTLPSPPGRLTYLAASILAGLVIGCLLAFFAEAASTRLVTVDQVLRAGSLPLLAVLPEFRSSSNRLGSQKESPYLEAVETLRSSLLSMDSKPPQVVLLTSPAPDEGKTTTAAHLAAVLAEHQQAVLLIDCDLRSHALAEYLALSKTVGLSSILTGQATFQDAMQPVPAVPALQVIVSGPVPAQRPAVLLGSAEFAALIQEARSMFSFIILNCPPVLGLADVLNAGPLADTIVLIVRSKLTRRKNLGLAEQTLNNAHLPIAGYVLNSASAGMDSYFYRSGKSTKQSEEEAVVL
jgi:succinoglycan biosynthesis transport protein ExoP